MKKENRMDGARLPLTSLVKRFLAVTLASLGLLAASFPDPVGDAARPGSGKERVVLAGGCFWGMEAVFGALAGTSTVVPGYAGGSRLTAHYEIVSTGVTGHAESVEITYDPARITFARLLKVYFSVAHDPTELNRQGPDTGTQYRSAIFYATREQERIAEAYIRQLDRAKVFSAPIVTQVVPLTAFYPAEAYHQRYVARHPDDPYVVDNDLPKLERLRKQFPNLVKGDSAQSR
jgi:peptide-methionine (S)-S-oxide reductase